MRPSTRLDSVVFQLTPTRTRCDLVITANGKTEKIASGLLDPFLAHLKAAQEQIGKGGYSIALEPDRCSDVTWFTKDTVERFVRFVSNPEILERVYTIESEILQIEKEISLQRNDFGSHIIEDHLVKSEECTEGRQLVRSDSEEKAIVLYKPNTHLSDGSTIQEGNSKVQLVRVLESRRTVLRKEQGMAFARAVAAGFDIDNIAGLLSFAHCFGASRMRDACARFTDLWKAKHENGQWVEVEAAEAMSYRSDFVSMNASGITISNSTDKQKEFKEPCPEAEVTSENNGISGATANAGYPLNYPLGHFTHPMFPHWPAHPQANGVPVFQSYPMQGVPYYQNFPGVGPFFQPSYSSADDSRLQGGRRTRHRRHSMDDIDNLGVIDAENSIGQSEQKKDGKSSRKESGKVIIRNINYIASTKRSSSVGDSHSSSDSEFDEEEKNKEVDLGKKLKPKEKCDKEKKIIGQEGESGHWQAFQNFLLKDADSDEDRSAKRGMFAMEGKVNGRTRKGVVDDRSSSLTTRDPRDVNGGGSNAHVDITREMNRMLKTSDESANCMMGGQEKLTDLWVSSLDPVISNGSQGLVSNNKKGPLHKTSDESFIVPQRLRPSDHNVGDGRAIDMDAEVHQKTENSSDRMRVQTNYEPNDLNLMPDRVTENGPTSYDPALDYQFQAHVEHSKKKEAANDVKQGPKKVSKEQRLKAERKSLASMGRGKPSKLSPSQEARARAERLRAFKADLQKLKKEKEEEQRKRLEALKMERQKRIAARSSSTTSKLALPSPQTRKSLPTKLSPGSNRGSKFSDTEPGSSSPLQRSMVRKSLSLSAESRKTPKPWKLANQLTRSASSLSERKEEKNAATPNSKATMARIRRLSDPKNSSKNPSLAKTRSVEASKRKSDVSLKKSTNKETTQDPNGSKFSNASEKPDLNRGDRSQNDDVDDNVVVEKTVVMLECTKTEQETSNRNVQPNQYHPPETAEERVSICLIDSSLRVNESRGESTDFQSKERSHSNQARADKNNEMPNKSTTDITEQPYQAPYARVSSLEDPCTVKSDYAKAPPKVKLDMQGTESTATHVSDNRRQNFEKIPEASGMPPGKESSKGLKRFLKFGRKNHGSTAGESSMESDKGSVDGSIAGDIAVNDSSDEVFTLKNLISQDEPSSTGTITTPQKSSRFSLLSPFRSKTSEKKTTS